MRRLAIRVTPAIAMMQSRFVKAHDPTYEDDRWLEAELSEKEKTPEERYAADQQKRVLAKMMAKMRQENREHIEAVKKEEAAKRDEHINDLRDQITALHAKLDGFVKK